jgi:hypothetical protein
MVIRRQQMEVFRSYTRQQFEKRMAAHLRAAFPEQTAKMTEPDLQAAVRARIEESISYGLDYEKEIERYLDYTVIYGAEFPSLPWAKAILGTGESGPTKVRQLEEQHHLHSGTKP